MKKSIVSIALLLAGFAGNAQTLDTNCVLIAGKATFHFNYKKGTIDSTVVDDKLQDKEFVINPNEVLVVDLYDNNKHVRSVKIKRRKLDVYYRDNTWERFRYNSGDQTLVFNGRFVKHIIIHRPIF